MKRRSFLRHVSHAMAVPGVIGSMGFKMPGSESLTSLLRLAADQDKVLVMIFLEGGNDGLNTVIPLDQLSALNKVRPHVILPENKMLNLEGTNAAFHPALTGLHSLYNESRLQVIQNVGYPEQNYSHFRSTDIWMTGSDSHQLVNSGWTGRYLNDVFPGYPEAYPSQEMSDPLSIELGYGSSLLFQGPTASMGMVIRDAKGFYNLINNEAEPAPDSAAGDKLKHIRLMARQSQQYGDVVKNAAAKIKNQKAYPQSDLGQQLKIVSRLIAGGMRTPLYLVRLGGFDTHDAQVEASDHTTGEHSDLLKDLNDSIMAFTSDLEMQGTEDRVLGMTFSEFGRRIISNASLGTDHGAAAPMFFFGNAVKGGINGENPVISSTSNYDDNLEAEFDFRQLYASVLDQWFGADNTMLENSLFKDFEQVPLIGSEVVAPLGAHKLASVGLLVFPNPMVASVTVRIEPTNEMISVRVVDLQGRQVVELYRGGVSQQMNMSWDTSRLSRGQYLVLVKGERTNRLFRVVK